MPDDDKIMIFAWDVRDCHLDGLKAFLRQYWLEPISFLLLICGFLEIIYLNLSFYSFRVIRRKSKSIKRKPAKIIKINELLHYRSTFHLLTHHYPTFFSMQTRRKLLGRCICHSLRKYIFHLRTKYENIRTKRKLEVLKILFPYFLVKCIHLQLRVCHNNRVGAVTRAFFFCNKTRQNGEDLEKQ